MRAIESIPDSRVFERINRRPGTYGFHVMYQDIMIFIAGILGSPERAGTAVYPILKLLIHKTVS
jgi:hypothetical protein